MSDDKVCLAIVGGGIAGLAFAIALAKDNARLEVHIYESASAFSEVGAGIGLWPRGWDTLRVLGLEGDLRPRISADAPIRFHKGDQASVVQFGQTAGSLQTYHRAEFLEALLPHIPPHFKIHFHKRLLSYEESSDAVVLRFKDGTSAACDILVGADGVKSVVRRTMYENLARAAEDPNDAKRLLGLVNAKWSGQHVYRSLVAMEEIERENPLHPALSGPVFYLGKDKYFISYPIQNGRLLNCAATRFYSHMNETLHDEPWVSAVGQDELLGHFEGWTNDLQVILSLMKTPSRWVVNCVSSLPTYISHRVAIMGDAAHAMTPNQGSGAGQGVEDSIVLAGLLADPRATKDTIPQVLQAYDQVRRPFSQDIVRRSHKTGMMYCFQNGHLKDVSAEDSAAGKIPLEQLEALRDDIAELLEWTWSTSAMGDRDRAVKLLHDMLEVAEPSKAKL